MPPDEYPVPAVTADSRPYWEAARAHRLLLRHCRECAHTFFPPRNLCPRCWSGNLDWLEASGRGSVHSFTVMRRAPAPEFARRVPYVVALIDLDEGARTMANVVGDDALQVAIGDRVAVCFEERAGGFCVPQFRREQGT